MKLRDQLSRYIPVNEQEVRDKQLLLQWLDSGHDIYTRENRTAHLTVSSWVVTPDRRKVLMAYHNLYDSWAWLGGHVDGEQDLLAVALREAREESGLQDCRPVIGEPISLEVLTVDGHEKRGEYISCHLHLNLTYLIEADADAPIRPKPDENSAVAWIDMDEIDKYSREVWFTRRIYPKLVAKSRRLGDSYGI